MSKEYDEKIDAAHREIAAVAATWTDEEFAAKIVGLLIRDKGSVNAWQRTIETMLVLSRNRDAARLAAILRAKAKETE